MHQFFFIQPIKKNVNECHFLVGWIKKPIKKFLNLVFHWLNSLKTENNWLLTDAKLYFYQYISIGIFLASQSILYSNKINYWINCWKCPNKLTKFITKKKTIPFQSTCERIQEHLKIKKRSHQSVTRLQHEHTQNVIYLCRPRKNPKGPKRIKKQPKKKSN